MEPPSLWRAGGEELSLLASKARNVSRLYDQGRGISCFFWQYGKEHRDEWRIELEEWVESVYAYLSTQDEKTQKAYQRTLDSLLSYDKRSYDEIMIFLNEKKKARMEELERLRKQHHLKVISQHKGDRPAHVVSTIKQTVCRCMFCKKLFNTDWEVEMFCSQDCYEKALEQYGCAFLTRYAQSQREVCYICGRAFYTARARQCRDCANSSMKVNHLEEMPPVYVKNCQCCGVTFVTPMQEKKVCSAWCREQQEFMQPHEKRCQVCGKTFLTRNMAKYTCGSESCKILYAQQLRTEAYREEMQCR